MQFTAIFILSVALTTAYSQQIYTPVAAHGRSVPCAKSNSTLRVNSTISGNSTALGNSTTSRNSTTGGKSKGNSSREDNTLLGGGGGSGSRSGACNCSCAGAGSGSKSSNGTGNGGNSTGGGTGPPTRAAGYAIEAADAGGLATIAGLGVAFALFL